MNFWYLFHTFRSFPDNLYCKAFLEISSIFAAWDLPKRFTINYYLIVSKYKINKLHQDGFYYLVTNHTSPYKEREMFHNPETNFNFLLISAMSSKSFQSRIAVMSFVSICPRERLQNVCQSRIVCSHENIVSWVWCWSIKVIPDYLWFDM